MRNKEKLNKGKNLLLGIVFVLLVASIAYAIYMFFQTPAGEVEIAGERMKRDYVLMILQCNRNYLYNLFIFSYLFRGSTEFLFLISKLGCRSAFL